jgi:hypothetical protein
MQIKDSSGKVIANIDLQDGISIQALVKSLSNKKSYKSLNTLVSLEESSDKKQIVLKFRDGSIFYDLPSKNFVRENGTKIGEHSFKNIKLEIKNKTICVDYRDNDNFWLCLAEKTEVVWIKTFFKMLDIWANNKNNRNWMGRRDRAFRNKIQRMMDDKRFFDSVESFSKIPQIQQLDDDGLKSFYLGIQKISDKIKNETKEKGLSNRLCINVGKSKMDNWFMTNISKEVSNVYIDKDVCLSNYIGDYIKCVDNGIKDLFQYVFETYRGVIVYNQIQKIKELIKFGYEPKRLMDYLYRDIYNQGEEIDIESEYSYSNCGSLGDFYDYVKMNREMKRDFEKYPRYLATMHNITLKNYKLVEDKIVEERFSERVKNLKSMNLEYIGDDYCIILPRNSKDLINEGQNLSHCVASYYKRMASGETNIVFLRKKNNIKESLVTIEVNIDENSKHSIVQAKGRSNSAPQKAEYDFIKKYLDYLNKEVKNVDLSNNC